MRRQPGDQAFHLLDRLGLRGAVLLRPALDLPRHIIFAAAVIGKPDRGRIEAVQPRQRGIHGVVDLARSAGVGRRHMRLPEHPALDIGHDEERGADDAIVGAIERAVRRPESPARGAR